MTCWDNELVQHYDIPPIGGHIKSCHRCGLTDDAWTQSCSALWPTATMKLFSIVTYRLLVVIHNHATEVDLLMMPENRIVQHHDLLKQWTCSALWHTTYWRSYKIMPQMWTYWWCLNTKLFSILTCYPREVAGVTWTRATKVVLPLMLEQRTVQHYDMPPSGGLTIPCHRMWSYWWCLNTKLLSIMTCHLIVVLVVT